VTNTEARVSQHSIMSKPALDSEKVRHNLKDILLGPARLYEALRNRADSDVTRPKSINPK
jgi:hypothetical protein